MAAHHDQKGDDPPRVNDTVAARRCEVHSSVDGGPVSVEARRLARHGTQPRSSVSEAEQRRNLRGVNGKTIALTIVAFLIGVLAAGGIGVRVIEEVRTTDDATSLPPENVATTTLPPSEYFVDPDETLIASTALVPTSVVSSGTGLAIEYDLISIAPTEGLPPIFVRSFRNTREIHNEELAGIFPETWVVATESDRFEGGPANADVRIARFELPEGVDASDVVSVEIIDPLIKASLDTHFELSQQSPTAEIVDGVQAHLLNISDQGDSVIVQIELVAEDSSDITFFVEGAGAGWRSANFSAEGRPSVNLTWVGDDLPEVMTFRAHGVQWIEIPGSYPVSVERFG